MDPPQTTAAKFSSSFRAVNRTPSAHPSPTSTQTAPRGRPLVLESSEGILAAFLFFYKRAPTTLVSWSISQQAFNSSMILLLDALETGNLSRIRKVEHAYAIFRELQDNGVHALASLAVEKLSWGLDQLRKAMGGYGTRRSPDKVESVGIVQDEADCNTQVSHDTVMGNTGMLLLDDTGLQSYTPERFVPFTWAATRADSEAIAPEEFKQEREVHLRRKKTRLADMELDGSNRIPPIANGQQTNAGLSQGSAPERFCDWKCPCRDGAHNCVTGPASPMRLAASSPQQAYNDGITATKHHRSQQIQLPFSPHKKSSWITPPTAFRNNPRLEVPPEETGSKELPQHWTQPMLSSHQHHMSAAQLRHNSCPSLHQSTTTPPFLRPTYSSFTANKDKSPVNNERCDMRTQWSANPADPVLDSPESGMGISPMSDLRSAMPASRHESAQQQQMMYQYSFPGDSVATSVDAIAVTSAEQMIVDPWKGWTGSRGPG